MTMQAVEAHTPTAMRRPTQGAEQSRGAWCRDLPLVWKLLGGFGLVVLLLAAAGGWADLQLRQQDAAYRSLLAGENQAAQVADDLHLAFLRQHQALKDVLLRGN